MQRARGGGEGGRSVRAGEPNGPGSPLSFPLVCQVSFEGSSVRAVRNCFELLQRCDTSSARWVEARDQGG